jgi:hypothetical protein
MGFPSKHWHHVIWVQAACQQLWQDMEADELLLAETETRVSQLCEQKDAEGAHEARFRQATAKCDHVAVSFRKG